MSLTLIWTSAIVKVTVEKQSDTNWRYGRYRMSSAQGFQLELESLHLINILPSKQINLLSELWSLNKGNVKLEFFRFRTFCVIAHSHFRLFFLLGLPMLYLGNCILQFQKSRNNPSGFLLICEWMLYLSVVLDLEIRMMVVNSWRHMYVGMIKVNSSM